MQTITEVARAVVANPDQYENAFPTSRPEIGPYPEFDAFVAGVMQGTRLRTHGPFRPYWHRPLDHCYYCNLDGLCVRREGDSAPVSVCLACLGNNNSYNRPPGGHSFVVDTEVPPGNINFMVNGEPVGGIENLVELQQAVDRDMEAATRRMSEMILEQLSNQTATGVQVLMEEQRRLLANYGDGSGELASPADDRHSIPV